MKIAELFHVEQKNVFYKQKLKIKRIHKFSKKIK